MMPFGLVVLITLVSTLHAAPPPPVDRVAFAPRADAVLPLDARFVDEHGNSVQLRDFFNERYAVVVPAYFGCSNLCSLVLRGVATSLAESRLRAGVDVDIVAVSIAPLETPALALSKKRELLASSPDAAGWHFLTGSDAEIGRVADALGYHYAYVPAERQYAHASGIAIIAPGGRITRVLYGVAFAPATLRNALALPALPLRPTTSPDPPVVRTPGNARDAPGPWRNVAETTRRSPDSPANWLLCFHYDPQAGRYTFVAMNAVRLAGLFALAALAAFAVRALLRERGTARRR